MADVSYCRVLPTFWTDPKVRRSLEAEQKLLLLYYFTSPHTNMLGIYYLPFAYVASETNLPADKIPGWTVGPLAPFVSYDPDTEEIFVHRAARHQVGEMLSEKDKRVKAINRILAGVHSPQLLCRFVEMYADWPLSDSIVEKCGTGKKPLRMPLPATVQAPHDIAVSVPEAEHEQEQNTVSDETGASTDDDKPEGVHAHFMPMLRQAGFTADDRDGSILKAIVAKGYRWEDIEAAVWGLAYARDTGLLEAGYGLGADDPLTLRILYAKNKGTGAPIWTDAVDVWYPKHLQRERGKRKPDFTIGTDTIRRALA